MKILITGATGFMGRHLTAGLMEAHDVSGVSRKPGSMPPGVTEVVIPTIDSRTDWERALKGVDAVVHLAARVHVMGDTGADAIDEYREINTRGTQRLAKACGRASVRKFVFMSTIKVNGEQTHGEPFAHDHPAMPRGAYAESKYDAEIALQDLASKYDLQTTVLRAPLVYGDGVKGNVARLLKLIQARVPIPLSRVHNRRTMLSTANLNVWVRRSLEECNEQYRRVLIGDPRPVSTSEIIRNLEVGMGMGTRLVPLPISVLRKTAKAFRLSATLDRLTEDLEVEPTYEMFPGITQKLRDPDRELRLFAQNYAKSDTALRAAGTSRIMVRPGRVINNDADET